MSAAKKKRKKQVFPAVAIVVSCEIYRHGVALVIGDIDVLKRHLQKWKYDLREDVRREIEDKSKRTEAWTFYTDEEKRDVTIYAPKPLTIPVLVHEICHAAQMTLDNVGVSDNEAFAYLVEYLFTEIVSSEASAQLLQSFCVPGHTAQSSIHRCQPCDRSRKSSACKRLSSS